MTGTLQTHRTENSKQIFPEMKLRGLVPNFHINVPVSDLYIPTIKQSDNRNKYKENITSIIFLVLTTYISVWALKWALGPGIDN